MKTNCLILGLLIQLAGLVITGCDNRKDIVPDLEKSSSKAPLIQIRRHNSGLPYATSFTDTTLINTTGYRLDFTVTGNADLNTLNLQCVSGCSNVTYTQIKKDSAFVLFYIANGTSANFTLTVKNKFEQSSTAYFNLVTINQKPTIKIRNFSYTLPFVQNLNDTIKTSINAVYNLEFQLSDDNATYSNISIKRVTASDANPYTISANKIDFNYAAITIPVNYSYKIYVTDPLGKTSDTCYLNINVFKNLLPSFDKLNSATYATLSSYNSDSYLGKYFTGNGPWYSYPATITINANDKDKNYGGYVKKIKWRVQYNIPFNGSTYDEIFNTNYFTSNNSFTLSFVNPFNKNPINWGGVYNRAYVSLTLYDNDNDSIITGFNVDF